MAEAGRRPVRCPLVPVLVQGARFRESPLPVPVPVGVIRGVLLQPVRVVVLVPARVVLAFQVGQRPKLLPVGEPFRLQPAGGD